MSEGAMTMRVKRKWIVLLALGGLVALVVSLTALRPDRRSDEERVRTLTDTCSRAVTGESVTRVLRLLADEYTDDLGDSRLSLRSHLAQAFVGPQEWRVSWRLDSLRAIDESRLEGELVAHVQLLEGGSVTYDRDAPMTVTFVRQGRELKVLRVTGLRQLADQIESSYGG